MGNDSQTEGWYDLDRKSDAVYKVLRYLAEHPDEGLECVGDDAKTREFFEDHGDIKVPADARVIFFAMRAV